MLVKYCIAIGFVLLLSVLMILFITSERKRQEKNRCYINIHTKKEFWVLSTDYYIYDIETGETKQAVVYIYRDDLERKRLVSTIEDFKKNFENKNEYLKETEE